MELGHDRTVLNPPDSLFTRLRVRGPQWCVLRGGSLELYGWDVADAGAAGTNQRSTPLTWGNIGAASGI